MAVLRSACGWSSNENLNELVRQYLPKGIDLSICSQKDFDRIAHSLNTRPRAVLGFQTPEGVFMAEQKLAMLRNKRLHQFSLGISMSCQSALGSGNLRDVDARPASLTAS
jgi:hypothetical protein